MYLDVGATSSNTATITVNLAASSASAKWNVLASQIECNTNYLAPSGCTMYLTGVTGSWSMYGYKTGVTTTEHLQSQDYNICIRRESGYCSIRHTAQSATSFDLTSAANADTAISARGAAACYADFIGIPGGSLDGNPATHDRYCGGVLGWSDPGVPVSQAIISKKYSVILMEQSLTFHLQAKLSHSEFMFTQMPLMPPQPHLMELLLTINNLLAKTSRPTLCLLTLSTTIYVHCIAML